MATALPDTDGYGSLAYPPAFADLSVHGTGLPELRIDGYVGATLAATVTMSSDSGAGPAGADRGRLPRSWPTAATRPG